MPGTANDDHHAIVVLGIVAVHKARNNRKGVTPPPTHVQKRRRTLQNNDMPGRKQSINDLDDQFAFDNRRCRPNKGRRQGF